MDLFEFIPFRSELVKAYHCLTDNATHTSEKPIFSELKVRRYEAPLKEISDLILDKVDNWIGWTLVSEKTAVGGMSIIRAEAVSFALFGLKIDVTLGLIQETDVNGRTITTVNAKAVTNIDARGDLGESRRALRLILAALDFEFRKQIIKDDVYLFRSIDPRGSTDAFQQIFDDSKLENTAATKTGTSIEVKPKTVKQVISLSHSPAKTGNQISPSAAAQGIPIEKNAAPAVASSEEGAKPSRPKVTIITMKKNS